MFDLKGKAALVTGASGGIGSAIAAALHQQGAKVALSGTRRDKLDQLAAQLGDGAVVVPANLSDPDAINRLVKEADQAMAGLDILVNNAGITRDNLLARMKDEEWQQVIDVNLTSAFRLARAVMRPMMKRRWGRIITVTSVVGTTGNPGQANYAAAKAGLAGMTKAIAQEVASRNITCNCVAPGFIDTPMTEALTDAQRGAILGNVPAGRLGHAEEIAAAIVYCASNEASYMTGQTLHINGGMAML